MNRSLITIGAVIIAAGLLWPWLLKGLKLLWGLPGNIVIRRENFTLYLPIALSIIVSIVLTIIIALLRGKGR